MAETEWSALQKIIHNILKKNKSVPFNCPLKFKNGLSLVFPNSVLSLVNYFINGIQ